MPNTTTNFGLKKPIENEYYDINIMNENSDKIDIAIKSRQDEHTAHLTSTTAHSAENITYQGGASSNSNSNVKKALDDIDDRIDNLVTEVGNSNSEIVDARDNLVGITYPTLKDRLDEEYEEVTAQLADNTKKQRYKNIQTEMLSKFYYKLMTKQSVIGVAEGDSLTYGHDVTSADKRPPVSTTTDNGVAHSFTRASVTYPEQLQANLNSIFGTTSTIINKGYSGDYADLSYQHWTKNENADFALVMLGTNDANNDSYIPVNKQRNVQAFVQDIRKIVERFLDWNTPVFLLAPPRIQQTETASISSRYVEPFRAALFSLGKEYGCPVIDMEEFCNGLDNTFYSDTLHFNGKGYAYLANRLTSIFVGLLNIPKIYPNSVIGIRPTRDNLVVNGATFSNVTNSDATEEGSAVGSSLLSTINVGNSLYLSFYAETDNLFLIPIHGLVSGGTAKYTLDGGSPQGSVPLLSAINKKYDERVYPPSVITSTISTNSTQAYDGTINLNGTTNYLHITNKGYHTIKIENGAGVGSVLFQGFVVRSYRDFANGSTIDDNSYTPILGATSVSGTHTYNKRVSKIKKVGSMVYHFTTLNITVDATISGSAYISLKYKPENITDFKVYTPIYPANGVFTDGTIIAGVLFADNATLYLQKLVNGVASNLTGADIQNKTIEITFTAIYPSV